MIPFLLRSPLLRCQRVIPWQRVWSIEGAFSVISIAIAILNSSPARAAERIYFNYGPLRLSLSVAALERFVEAGHINQELGFYLNRMSPQQQTQLRSLLKANYPASPTLVYRFARTSSADRLLNRIGDIIQIPHGLNGFYAIRGALVHAASAPEGVSLIEFIRQYPTDIELNTTQIRRFLSRANHLIQQTNAVMEQLEAATTTLANTEPPLKPQDLPVLHQPGPFAIAQQTLTLDDASRQRRLVVELYLPRVSHSTQTPLIVFSNGLGSRRDRFSELSRHLASHGFAVAVPDHPGSDRQRQKAFITGLYRETFESSEFIDRPKDITYLLDHLEQLNQTRLNHQLNLEKIGIFGYSFGGSTALSLAGATIDFAHLKKACESQDDYLLNISILYQCRALEQPQKNYKFHDPRIKAAFLFVPFSNRLFSQKSMNAVKIPIMWEATNNDLLTPLLLEQIPAYRKIDIPHRYLIVYKDLPHTRIILSKQQLANWEQIKQIAFNYQSTLSLAFFKVYVTQDKSYQPYLQASYAQAISDSSYRINFTKSFPLQNSQ